MYANDPSWTGFFKRLFIPSYDIPLALLPWVDGLQRAIPDLNTRDFLLGNSTMRHPTHSFLTKALGAADKLIFDYLLDGKIFFLSF